MAGGTFATTGRVDVTTAKVTAGTTNTIEASTSPNDLVIRDVNIGRGSRLSIGNSTITGQIGATGSGTSAAELIAKNSANWSWSSSVTIAAGVSVNMLGLNDFKYTLTSNNGIAVANDASLGNRVSFNPISFSTVWALQEGGTAVDVVDNVRYVLFSNSAQLGAPKMNPFQTSLSSTKRRFTLLELANNQIAMTVVPRSELFLTSDPRVVDEWEGACFTGICSKTSPCRAPTKDVTLEFYTPECTINAVRSGISPFDLNILVPAASTSSQKITLVAYNDAVTGTFNFKATPGATTAVAIELNALVGASFDTTATTHGIFVDLNLPETTLTCAAMLVNPRIQFAGPSLILNSRCKATLDAAAYSIKSPISVSHSRSIDVSFVGSKWVASSTTPNLLPLRMTGAAVTSVYASNSAILENVAFSIGSGGLTAVASSLTGVAVNTTGFTNITSTTLVGCDIAAKSANVIISTSTASNTALSVEATVDAIVVDVNKSDISAGSTMRLEGAVTMNVELSTLELDSARISEASTLKLAETTSTAVIGALTLNGTVMGGSMAAPQGTSAKWSWSTSSRLSGGVRVNTENVDELAFHVKSKSGIDVEGDAGLAEKTILIKSRSIRLSWDTTQSSLLVPGTYTLLSSSSSLDVATVLATTSLAIAEDESSLDVSLLSEESDGSLGFTLSAPPSPLVHVPVPAPVIPQPDPPVDPPQIIDSPIAPITPIAPIEPTPSESIPQPDPPVDPPQIIDSPIAPIEPTPSESITSQPPKSKSTSKKLPAGAWVGVAIGILLIASLIVVVLLFALYAPLKQWAKRLFSGTPKPSEP